MTGILVVIGAAMVVIGAAMVVTGALMIGALIAGAAMVVTAMARFTPKKAIDQPRFFSASLIFFSKFLESPIRVATFILRSAKAASVLRINSSASSMLAD